MYKYKNTLKSVKVGDALVELLHFSGEEFKRMDDYQVAVDGEIDEQFIEVVPNGFNWHNDNKMSLEEAKSRYNETVALLKKTANLVIPTVEIAAEPHWSRSLDEDTSKQVNIKDKSLSVYVKPIHVAPFIKMQYVVARFGVPTEFHGSKPQMFIPHEGRVYETFLVHDNNGTLYDSRSIPEKHHKLSKILRNYVYAVEDYSDWGDDGHIKNCLTGFFLIVQQPF